VKLRGIVLRLLWAALAIVLLLHTPGLPDALAQTEPMFRLPFAEPPGPNTWLLGQNYGNTTSAYRMRNTMYAAGQGIHFGIDFLCPCGTPIVAMADGVVYAADEPRFGSLPHNLLIDHPDLGYSTFYGHLLEPPNLVPGQIVKAGDVIGLTGDPAETCYGRPHLHLEIRDLGHWRKFNPVLLVDAEWNQLALIGSFSSGFQRDLNDPRRWQHLDDQPETIAGGPMLNDYNNTWPPDRDGEDVQESADPEEDVPVSILPSNAEQDRHFPDALSIQSPIELGAPIVTEKPPIQLTPDGCCVQPTWRADSEAVVYLDRNPDTDTTGLYSVPIDEPLVDASLFSSMLVSYSADYDYRVLTLTDAVEVQQLSWPNVSGGSDDPTVVDRWVLPVKAERTIVSPDGSTLVWQQSSSDAAIERRVAHVWTLDLDHAERRYVGFLPRGSIVGWLSSETILVSFRVDIEAPEQTLCELSLKTATCDEIVTTKGLRDPKISSDSKWIAYYSVFNDLPQSNGIWVTSADVHESLRLPPWMFGAYAWRDDTRLLVIPMRPSADSQQIWQVDLQERTASPISGYDANLKIANADWSISPDGHHIAYVEDSSRSIWVLRLPD
jgi:hypothetical protein